MDNHIILKVLFFSLPQFFILMIMTNGFYGKRMDLKKWIIISLNVAIIENCIRGFVDGYIIYALILFLIDILAIFMVNHGIEFKWIICILLSETITRTTEFICIQVLILLFNINPLNFSRDIALAIKCFIPIIIIQSFIAIYVYKKQLAILPNNR